ncbi:MAG: hypothetical protein LQ347_006929 [Umbilicaria vellea]|nr:MAG: hypothetical protein LQ347_006929 [Umbilicaria vellea]
MYPYREQWVHEWTLRFFTAQNVHLSTNLRKAHDTELTSKADALQIIGCIPRSPSPEPSIKLPPRETGRQSAVPKPDPTPDSSRDRRISALEVKIARLERSLKVEPEAVASASGSANTRGVKREYDDDEVVCERKRNRPSGSIETVDLTED